VIDEARQETEPEIVIPLSKYLGPSTALLLIGDTRQLGPTTISQDRNVRTILGTSFMEKLTARREISTSADTVSLFLSEQYRMHSKLAAFVSQTFYRGSLRSRRSRSESSLICLREEASAVCVDTSGFCPSIPGSPNRPEPGERIVIPGMRQGFLESRKGTSYINEGQAILTAKCFARVMNETQSLRPKNIAVISPYSGQRDLIKHELLSLDETYGDRVMVDTIDVFQGKDAG
jgi:superfamily I DNA and/or RNA helicase